MRNRENNWGVKPELGRLERRAFKKAKWDHAAEVKEELTNLGFEVHEFPSLHSPHLRIKGTEYWPATQRFFDLSMKKWGLGYAALKEHLTGVRNEK